MDFKKLNGKKTLWIVFTLTALLLPQAFPTSAQQPVPTPSPAKPNSPASSSSIFLPVISLLSSTDLTVDAMDITQAVQTDANGVPLVANRPTVVRIYAKTNTAPNVSGVMLALNVYKGSTKLGTVNAGPVTLSTTWTRGALTSSFNAQIPSAWLANLSGSITFEAVLNPSKSIPERNYTNDTLSLTKTFNSVPALNVTVVPINYTDMYTGITYNHLTNYDYLRAELLKIYPVSSVNITQHATLTYSGDLTDSAYWSDLLDQIYSMRPYGNTSTVYYGVIPLKDTSGNSWFYGGIAGLGYVGERASIGLGDAPDVIGSGMGGEVGAHEIGHNLGRSHSPSSMCNTTPGNIDPNYPYKTGMIGQFGFDLPQSKVVLNTAPDIMGYCPNRWISDYTYNGMFNNQVAKGAPIPAAPQAPALLVRASLGADGAVTLRPGYTFVASPNLLPAKSDYAVEFVDAAGKVVATQPLALLHAGEPGIEVTAISSIVAQPSQPYASYRIVQNGKTMAEKSLAAAPMLAPASLPQVQSINGQATLTWTASKTPALVRVTADGQTWTTLGVDVASGQLALDLEALPKGTLHFEILQADGAASPLTLDWENQ